MASSTPASNSAKVWLITGCSSGIGRQLAIAARKRGDLVIATARKVETLDDLKKLGCEALALDISASADAVKQVIDKAHAFYGRIDILVNNAGDTTIGAIEEANDQETLTLFDTNVFGHLRVTRAVLPHMREKRSGIIANIGSAAGYFATPVNSLYGAAKFALAGVTQSLASEVAHLGIEVTLIEPGMFKTRDMTRLNVFEQSIADYDPVKKAVQEQLAAGFGIPPQNPAKGAQAIVEALTKTGHCAGRALPRRMPLGGELRPLLEAELAARTKELNAWAIFTHPEAFAFDP
ncbi:hypothetical protein Poli38472_007575 [Pythium oligandrum]|uniref:Uncharacterized protein n=1 Tax=Pythium oligandrum TaxID=41045 RepID=A0A8K1FRT8_PYTOL|nr:hypothetical protein Poli38472_007575 [Pythium oligandrum]|eukprot:TMW67903.1 hypothetical protein Poli38472_007575 [Pythium oligandrum]